MWELAVIVIVELTAAVVRPTIRMTEKRVEWTIEDILVRVDIRVGQTSTVVLLVWWDISLTTLLAGDTEGNRSWNWRWRDEGIVRGH